LVWGYYLYVEVRRKIEDALMFTMFNNLNRIKCLNNIIKYLYNTNCIVSFGEEVKKTIRKKKLFTLIWITALALTTVFVTVGLSPTYITLPYTITQAGWYIVDEPNPAIYGIGLQIEADNVYVDFQSLLQTQADQSDTIFCNGHSDITIVNCNQTRINIGTSGAEGIRFEHVHDFLIANSTFKRNFDNYIYGNCYSYVIEDCWFDQTVWHGLKHYGIDGYNHHDFIVRRCKSTNTQYWGFTSQGCYDFTWEYLLTENTSSNAGAYGYITDGPNHHFEVLNCRSVNDYRGYSFLNARYATIYNFSCTGDYFGISLEDAKHIQIEECCLSTDNGLPIRFSGDNIACDNITIYKSTIGSAVFGVYTAKGDNIQYVQNSFIGLSNRPIYEAGGVNHTLLHNTYSGNSSANKLSPTGLYVDDSPLNEPQPTPSPSPTPTPTISPEPTPDPTLPPLTPDQWVEYWNWKITQDEEFKADVSNWYFNIRVD
jgi:hypothetical protein